MKKDKIVKAAEGAKKDGYEFMTSIVLYVNGKPKYNIVSIDVILQFERWIPATPKLITPEDGGEPYKGIRTWDSLPPKSISRTDALRRYGK